MDYPLQRFVTLLVFSDISYTFYPMASERTNRTLAIYRLLLNDSNLKILRELRKGPRYILELEGKVGLDRSTIKRRLYVLVDLDLVETETKETPRGGKAVYYELNDVKLPSMSLYSIIADCDIDEIRELSRIYRY